MLRERHVYRHLHMHVNTNTYAPCWHTPMLILMYECTHIHHTCHCVLITILALDYDNMANFVKNELLCFVQNKFGNYAAQNIQGVSVTFYEENEIVEAKKDLHEILVDMLGDDVVPRFKPRNAGDSKKRLDTEDLIKFFVLSDEKHTALPTFVAVNLNRIPSMKATDLDLSVMVNRMEMLQNSLSSVHMQLDDLRSNNVKLDLKMEELRNTTKTGLNAPVHSKSTESKAVSSFSCDPDVLTVRLPSLDEPSSNPNASVKAKKILRRCCQICVTKT